MIARFGTCRVLEEIGSGAISTVYKAIQEPLGRTVAVKALRSTIATTSPFSLHLEREARILGLLGHPNVVSLLDFVHTEDELYLVLEYVDGRSLLDVLGRRKGHRPESVGALGVEVARGLAHVHERGFVHRDVKPANILLSKAGEVKLLDFGIAERERPTREYGPSPEGGANAFGTPAYMSPEQILGEHVDARSDLFSLGVVLYEMAAGRRPFDDDGDGRTAAQRIRRDPPRPLRSRAGDVSPVLERVIMRLLEKLPADRFGSAAAVVDELDHFLRSEARPTTSPRKLLVRALKDVGLTQIVTPFDGASYDATLPSSRPSLRRALTGFGALSALLLAGAATVRSTALDVPPTSGDDGLVVPTDASLFVVAAPWAEVSVDGHRVDTTPFARPIPLRAGKHFVTLTHPGAAPERRAISVSPGESVRLDVEMRMHDALEAGAVWP